MKKILYPSRIEENNLGDILINALLVRELMKTNTVYFKGVPNRQFLELISITNSNVNFEIIEEIQTDKPFIITKAQTLIYLLKKPGFDLVFDTPGHISGTKSFLRNQLKAFLELFKIITYRSLGVRYLKYGITLGPYTDYFWFYQKIIARLSFLIVVRDKSNYKSLIERGLKNTFLKPDLAFLLQSTDGILQFKNPERNKEGVVTISLRGSIYGKELDELYFKSIAEDTIDLIQKLSSIKKIEQIIIAYQVDADASSSKRLNEVLNRKLKNIKIVFLPEILRFENAAELYSWSEIVITNRLHVFLFAMACKTKSYIVTDVTAHKKLVDIARDLGMYSLIYSSMVDINWDTALVDEFLKQSNAYRDQLKEHINSL